MSSAARDVEVDDQSFSIFNIVVLLLVTCSSPIVSVPVYEHKTDDRYCDGSPTTVKVSDLSKDQK